MTERKRRCTKCGIIFPENSTYFYKDTKEEIGLSKNCKWCSYKSKTKDKTAPIRQKAFMQTYATKSIRLLMPIFLLELLSKKAKEENCSASWVICHAIVNYLKLPETIIEDIRGFKIPQDKNERVQFYKQNPDLKERMNEARNIKNQERNTEKNRKKDIINQSTSKQVKQLLYGIYPIHTSKKVLADKLQVSEKTIQRALKELKDSEIIVIQYKGRGGLAEISFHPKLYNSIQQATYYKEE